jgi:hypothetical protein
MTHALIKNLQVEQLGHDTWSSKNMKHERTREVTLSNKKVTRT